MSSSRDAVQVVRAWRDMELFSPQTVDRADPGADAPSIDWERGTPLPWEPGSHLDRKRLPPKRVWRHTVYLWIYDLSVMYECLDRVYRDDEEVYDERPLGQSAAACFVVDESGRLDADSVVLSSAAWGLGRALATGRRSDAWFDDFARDAELFATALAHLVGLNTEDPAATGRVITADILLKIGALTRQATGLPAKSLQAPAAPSTPDPEGADPLPVLRIARIKSSPVDPDNEAPPSDFLNSFILDDLGRVIDAVHGGRASPALADYLAAAGGATPSNRRDTVADADCARPHVGPDAIPYGRWPNRPHESLATSQQLAVDLSLNDLTAADRTGARALRSVNGPPGTGKTTLLRDVFAGLIVERARQLAALPDPARGFTGEKIRWKVGEITRVLHIPAPQLTGYEMVVASANNAAVQNISDELPGADAVKEPWSDAGYLRDIATRVRQVVTKDDDAQAWGMTAARLGNKNNRREFVDAFWTNKREWRDEPRSFRHLLEESEGAELKPWAEATRDFHAALARVDTLLAEARRAQTRLDRRPRLVGEIGHTERVLADLVATDGDLAERLRAAEHESLTATAAHDVAEAQLNEHRRQRPGWWGNLVTLGEARRTWEAEGAPLRVAAQAADARRSRAQAVVDDTRGRLTTARRDLADAQSRRSALLTEQRRLERQCTEDRQRWGDAYPDAQWFDDVERREKTTPWSNPELNAARSESFLAALDLHVAWFRHCSRQLIPSVRAAMDVVRGSVPRDLDPEAVRTAWQVFFLVVPLVSTTFASFGRMFSHLGAESLGWVFIDEAGQATPQSAAGALWRARHALVVGDPLQLTPIVTLPTKAEANIALQHRVPRLALPSQTSAQKVADGANPWGATMGAGDDALWVGTPLRVHRRCDDPMFTISNEVAYGGLMIHGIPAGARKPSPLSPSAWLHVRAQGGNGHALAKDLAVVESLVRDLLAGAPGAGGEPVPAEEIIVISPFRAMANALARLPQRLGAPVRAGTVHTAQGQEADVVVFALGGDPARPGARTWAAATPNLVNVAASRAKKRLYVVGDHQAWSPLPHFTTLAGHLARRDVTAEELWGA